VGFPMLRLVGLICLSCGAVLDMAMGPYAGKQTGETALLRQLLGGLDAGDVLLGDACFANYWTTASLLGRGEDLLVQWPKPPRPAWMSRRMYRDLPESLPVRELRVAVDRRGFRTRRLCLVTTLLDASLYSAADLAAAY